VTKRSLDPRAGRVAANVDLERGRKSGQEQALGVALASEVTANELRRDTAATAAFYCERAGQDLGQ